MLMSETDSHYYCLNPGETNSESAKQDEAVVKPVKGKRTPTLGADAILVGTSGDLERLVQSIPLHSVNPRPLFNSRLYVEQGNPSATAVVGPIVGAPYAAMVLETLIVWGARRFIFLGWCGAVSPEVAIGDLIIPTAALIDEGTSLHYPCVGMPSDTSYPEASALGRIRGQFVGGNTPFREGAVWTTDAIFRETPAKVRRFLAKGALAVDMETSALLTIARYRGVEIGSILVVSDELSTLKWVPGFKSEAFASGRTKAYEVIRRLCLPLTNPKSSL